MRRHSRRAARCAQFRSRQQAREWLYARREAVYRLLDRALWEGEFGRLREEGEDYSIRGRML